MARKARERMVMERVVGLALFAFLWVPNAGLSATTTGNDRRPAAERLDEVEARITGLIEQMGAEQYAVRERAQEQLRELGLVAFDALLEASRHEDVEIAMRARYLVRSLPVQWSLESDPSAVKSILRNYATAGRDERRDRMQQLTALPEAAGIPALCRLMRFEVDILLSKEAALIAMNHTPPSDADRKSELAEHIRQTVGLSERTAARWLRTYAESLVAAAPTLDAWEQLVLAERDTFAQFPERTDRLIVRDLLRWQADMLQKLGHHEEFMIAIGRALELVEGKRVELFDFVDWALEREAWHVVDEIAVRFPTEFDRHAILVYRLAEAQHRRGDRELADQTAQRALALEPEHPENHNLLAEYLTTRLLYDWAEQEYRFVIETTKPSPNEGLHLEARFYLADLLFDLQRELSAAETLKAAVEAINDNPKLLQPTRRTAEEIKSALHYYYAIHFGRQGDRDKQIEHLEEAFKIFPANPDFLIAMYRIPEGVDDRWRQTVLERIETSQSGLHDRIQLYERVAANPRNETERLEAMDQLARASNELAWLISNTTGDYAAAIRHSHRSLELKPEFAAYLDTLGRCYYADGDLENAVKYQTQAVERAPYYQQIRRQLKLFEEALAAAQAHGA